jgi:hypothetical protein
VPQHHWTSKLLGYDFHVEFKLRATNVVADALSRHDTDTGGEVMASSRVTFKMFDDLRHEFNDDPDLRTLCDEAVAGNQGPKWQVVDGLPTMEGKVFIPSASPFLIATLEAAHGVGHEGIEKTLHRYRTDFFVHGAHGLVKEFVRNCATCQRNKGEHLHSAGLLQPLDVPSSVWSDLVMDFVEDFPRVNSKTVVLTVVDRFSKYAHFIPLAHPYTATTVARVFFDNIVRLHGVPSTIVSYHNPVFTSKLWGELFALAGVKLQLSSAFHPQSDV